MKKKRSVSGRSSGKGSRKGYSGRRTKSSSGTSFGGKKSLFSFGGKSGSKRGKKPFRKPSHDPGPKEREGLRDDLMAYQDQEEGTSGIQQALGGTGCGCCSSLAGLVWLVVLGAVAVVVILALKCGGC